MAGGGVGEAALMGAAFGVGRSLLTGKGDPLENGVKGAMLGTAGGALMGGATPGAGAGFDYANALGSAEGASAMPEYGYTWNQASGMLEPASSPASWANATSGEYGAAPNQWDASRWAIERAPGVAKDAALGLSPDAMAQFYGSDMSQTAMAAPPTPQGGIASLPAAEQAVAAGQAPAAPAAAGTTITPPITTPTSISKTPTNKVNFLENPLGWMQDNKMKTAAGALGLYTLANMGNLTKPNYMTPYQPPTADQYGLGARLAANYKPVVVKQAGGVVEEMSKANAIGQNTGYPQADINQGAYSTPWQTPVSRNMIMGAEDTNIDPLTGQAKFAGGGGISGLMNYAKGGGIADLGGYSDGGRMLRGPGDGMSDSIPASISGKQPARLADGEFVVPADVVSHLGNGSTDAGAKQLYRMMDKVRTARTGRKSQGKQISPKKYMPA